MQAWPLLTSQRRTTRNFGRRTGDDHGRRIGTPHDSAETADHEWTVHLVLGRISGSVPECRRGEISCSSIAADGAPRRSQRPKLISRTTKSVPRSPGLGGFGVAQMGSAANISDHTPSLYLTDGSRGSVPNLLVVPFEDNCPATVGKVDRGANIYSCPSVMMRLHHSYEILPTRVALPSPICIRIANSPSSYRAPLFRSLVLFHICC